MTPANFDGPYAHTAGWLVSFALHGSVILGAFMFVQQVQLAPQLTPFKWNVAMVTPERPSATPLLPSPVASPPLSRVRSTPVPTSTTTPVVQPQSPKAITQIMAPTPATKPSETTQLQTVLPLLQKPTEPIVMEQVQTRPIEHARSPARTEPAPTARQIERIGNPESAHSIPEQPMPVTSTTPPPTPVHEPTAPPVASANPTAASTPSIDSSPSVSTPSTQVASLAAPTSHAPIKTDYGWLSETILRRVEEVKRYPAEARLDRAEGKVVLKAAIRDDGSVDDVEVFQSSGYRSLDHAAVELMKQAAPFHLPHPLGKSKVTVKIPMSYRLDR